MSISLRWRCLSWDRWAVGGNSKHGAYYYGLHKELGCILCSHRPTCKPPHKQRFHGLTTEIGYASFFDLHGKHNKFGSYAVSTIKMRRFTSPFLDASIEAGLMTGVVETLRTILEMLGNGDTTSIGIFVIVVQNIAMVHFLTDTCTRWIHNEVYMTAWPFVLRSQRRPKLVTEMLPLLEEVENGGRRVLFLSAEHVSLPKMFEVTRSLVEQAVQNSPPNAGGSV